MRLTPTVALSAAHDRRAIALGTVAALALVLAGCAGSKSATTAASTPAKAATATAETTASSSGATETKASSATATSASGATTPPGTKLALGAPAIVDYQPGVSGKSPTFHIQVTALGIKKAPQSDFNGVELEKAQQGQTPFYVTLQIRNLGAGDLSSEEIQPMVGFQATDDRGQPGQELTILGNFRPCKSNEVPKPFTRGVTYQTCQIFFVGGGGSIVQEEWTGSGGDAYSENPIVWKAG